jgi:hypothetical protein
MPAGPLLVVPGQLQEPPAAAPPPLEPLTDPLTALESLLAPPETPELGEALTLPLAFVLLFTFVLLLTLVFVLLLSAPDAALPEVDGLALGLEVADWSVIVPWVPEPMFVELDWLVVVL